MYQAWRLVTKGGLPKHMMVVLKDWDMVVVLSELAVSPYSYQSVLK